MTFKDKLRNRGYSIYPKMTDVMFECAYKKATKEYCDEYNIMQSFDIDIILCRDLFSMFEEEIPS